MKKKYQVLALLLVVILLWYSPGISMGVSLEELQQAQEEVEEKINRYKNIIQTTQKEITSVSSEMASLDQRIRAREIEIEALETTIAEKMDLIASLEEDIVMAELGFIDRQKTMQARLRAIYENKDVSFLDVMVDATDMTDFLVRFELLTRLAGGDINMLDDLDAQRKELESMKLSLVADQMALQDTKGELESSQASLSSAKNSKESLQEKLLSEKALAQKALDEEEQSNKEIEKLIKDYIASQANKGVYEGGKFSWPTPGNSRITSQYGWRIHPITKTKSMHTGIDIAAPRNAAIVAVAGGKVIYAAWYGAYGNCTIIDHGGGLTSMYGHQNKLGVKEGEIVLKGDQIGYVGTTGLSTGNHLHFEVRLQGNHTTPWPYLNGEV